MRLGRRKVHGTHHRRADEKNSIKGGSGWFFDLENFCRTYEAEQIPREPVRLEKTGTLLLDAEYIDNYCREQFTLSNGRKDVHAERDPAGKI